MNFLNEDLPPAGMIRHDELLNLLVSLDETGGCDRRTLRIVAQGAGIREYFDRQVAWLTATGNSMVATQKPVLLLEKS